MIVMQGASSRQSSIQTYTLTPFVLMMLRTTSAPDRRHLSPAQPDVVSLNVMEWHGLSSSPSAQSLPDTHLHSQHPLPLGSSRGPRVLAPPPAFSPKGCHTDPASPCLPRPQLSHATCHPYPQAVAQRPALRVYAVALANFWKKLLSQRHLPSLPAEFVHEYETACIVWRQYSQQLQAGYHGRRYSEFLRTVMELPAMLKVQTAVVVAGSFFSLPGVDT